MQSCYPECFDREMGCTEADWLGWLPGAVGQCPWNLQDQAADVWFGNGALDRADQHSGAEGEFSICRG